MSQTSRPEILFCIPSSDYRLRMQTNRALLKPLLFFSVDTDTPKVNGDIIDNDIPENTEDIPSIPVRAKYDYEASEDDELSFHVGDIITQLSGEDGQGWCKGRLNGIEGLFPAKWVEAV